MIMDWLNALNNQWAPVLWIIAIGAFFLIRYLALRAKHQFEIKNAAIEVHRKRFKTGEISREEFNRLKKLLVNN